MEELATLGSKTRGFSCLHVLSELSYSKYMDINGISSHIYSWETQIPDFQNWADQYHSKTVTVHLNLFSHNI